LEGHGIFRREVPLSGHLQLRHPKRFAPFARPLKHRGQPLIFNDLQNCIGSHFLLARLQVQRNQLAIICHVHPVLAKVSLKRVRILVSQPP
jgi:hypothetical protein